MDKKQHNLILKFLRQSSNIWYFAEGMLGPLFAVFANKIGGDMLDITWAWGVFLLVSGSLIIVVGKISNKLINRNALIFTGYLLNTFFTFSYLLIDSPWELFFVQIGLGIASALATPTWDGFYAEVEEKLGEKDNAWGLADGEKDILMGIGIFTGGIIVSLFSFDSLFITMGILQAIATIQVYICIRKSKEKRFILWRLMKK